ncbi:inositol monophosphatase family protein [Bosea beijingensis]
MGRGSEGRSDGTGGLRADAGLTCHAYGRVSGGALDISVYGGLDPSDDCAMAPIVRNAGGAITDWDGRELTIHSGHRCVVASGSSASMARSSTDCADIDEPDGPE